MRTALRYLLTIILGLALGAAAAVHSVRTGASAATIAIGPWRTGRDFGTAAASAKTRAVVALTGLLALPAHEARYYTADTDDAGQPLDGRCSYAVSGGSLPARWWSLTLYDQAGYLAGAGPYSVESAAVGRVRATQDRAQPPAAIVVPRLVPGRWSVVASPRTSEGGLSTAGLPHFQLTLRLYLPADGGRGDPPRSVLPAISREQC